MKTTLSAVMLPLLALMASPAAGLTARDLHLQKRFGVKGIDHPDPDIVGNATFKQTLDHSNPNLGTFDQRYWWDASYYKPGGPVFLFNAGESAADGMGGFVSNRTIPGLYAQQFNGVAILIEHRYWGNSIPSQANKTMNAETLQYLNLPNSIQDMTNFASNVELEFCDDGGKCNAQHVPWVLVGGSYSGALAAWTSQIAPNVFAAYHASSAVVEAIYDFWWYYTPVLEALPKNCTNDIQAVVDHIDTVFAGGDKKEIKQMKSWFNLQDLGDADFAHTIAAPITLFQNDRDAVMEFCDYIETQNGTARRVYDKGVGLVTTLNYYASYINLTSGCGDGGSECDTFKATMVWNTPDEIDDTRPWQWMLCNEPFGWWPTGPAEINETNIVSTQLRPDYYERRCPLMFPETNGHVAGSVRGFKEQHLNLWTKGWDAPYERVIFVNGEFDPWRSATVSSQYRPGGPLQSSDGMPIYIVPDGVHTPELWIDRDNAGEWAVVEACVETMGAWLKGWSPPEKA